MQYKTAGGDDPASGFLMVISFAFVVRVLRLLGYFAPAGATREPF